MLPMTSPRWHPGKYTHQNVPNGARKLHSEMRMGALNRAAINMEQKSIRNAKDFVAFRALMYSVST
jgi:hypothetical protein